MRSVTHTFTAAANGRGYLIDRDTLLVGVTTSTTGVCVVSFDPAATATNRSTGQDGFFNDDLAVFAGIGLPFGQTQSLQLSFQLRRGDVIYLSRSGSGSISLFFIDS